MKGFRGEALIDTGFGCLYTTTCSISSTVHVIKGICDRRLFGRRIGADLAVLAAIPIPPDVEVINSDDTFLISIRCIASRDSDTERYDAACYTVTK
jgi:hypothetical protein